MSAIVVTCLQMLEELHKGQCCHGACLVFFVNPCVRAASELVSRCNVEYQFIVQNYGPPLIVSQARFSNYSNLHT